MTGRFAPSPTSDLHLGNLRTAVVAALLARAAGVGFLVRIEDLVVGRVGAAGDVATRQLHDLALLGLSWDGPVVHQSARLDRYRAAVDHLPTYECFCTRREIAESASAPHADGYRPYPGTCLRLSEAERLVHEHPGVTAYELAGLMTWRIRAKNWADFPPSQKGFAFGETLAHLDTLLASGAIERLFGENGIVTYR